MMTDRSYSQLKVLWLRQIYQEYRYLRDAFGFLRLPNITFKLSCSHGVFGAYHVQLGVIEISEFLVRDYPWYVVIEVLKHEVAHVCDAMSLSAGSSCLGRPHGENFLKFAEILEVQPWARGACLDVESVEIVMGLGAYTSHTNRVIRQVHRLLQLANSDNEHEAQQATKKAHQLIEKHHIEKICQQGLDSQFIRKQVCLHTKRVPKFLYVLVKIVVDYFYVDVVVESGFNSKTGSVSQFFSIMGRKEHVEVAEYVFVYLRRCLEQGWILERKLRGWSGIAARNAYLMGGADGFHLQLLEKDRAQKGRLKPGSRSLILIEQQKLNGFVKKCFPRLKSVSRSRDNFFKKDVYEAGFEQGKKLRLDPGIKTNSKTPIQLLSE